jgi:hypothetical protein
MSDTPRTDALLKDAHDSDGFVELARQLERDLNKFRESSDYWHQMAMQASVTPLADSDLVLLPGLREALKWKPNTPQLENAMTYAWESALKSFVRVLEEKVRVDKLSTGDKS